MKDLISTTNISDFWTVSTKRRKRYTGHKKRLYIQQRGVCKWCGRGCIFGGDGGTPEEFTVDHIIPLKVQGTNHYRNLVGSCFACNSKRNRRWWEIHLVLWRTV